MAKPYQKDIDFAFFVVRFGYSKKDYQDLTPREAAFIRKAWEDKVVSESTMIRNAVLNAVGNALRKKNSRFRDLWKKLSKPVDKELESEHIRTVHEIEAKEGKSWIDRILKANGIFERKKVNHA